MRYIMNSAVMPAGCYGKYSYNSFTVEGLQEVLAGVYGPYASFVGYQQTADIIEKWTGVKLPVNRSEVAIEDGDEMIVVRLRNRVQDPKTKGAPVTEGIGGWELATVRYEQF